MAFNRNNKSKGNPMKQTVFSKTKEIPFNPSKQWTATYEVEGKSFIVHCPFETKVRSAAVRWFEKIARSEGGTLSTVQVIK